MWSPPLQIRPRQVAFVYIFLTTAWGSSCTTINRNHVQEWGF